jgi:sugar O-acyltransferase (sialic acid O-acetyltransferase NeuD family)
MKQIIVIGASGHSAEIQDYIDVINRSLQEPIYRVEGFLDDDPMAFARFEFKGANLGGIKDHKIVFDAEYVMGIAKHEIRRTLIDIFLEKGARFETIIHPSSYISMSAQIGAGCIIGPNVNIGPNVQIGDYNLLNSRSSLGHGTRIGSNNIISPNVSFSGDTLVGDDNLFGVNSATIPGLSIGNRNKIEAGMIVSKDILDDTIVFHRFKEKVIAVPKRS